MTDIVPRVTTPRSFTRVQVTLCVTATYNPVPDAIIIRGRRADWAGRQPTAADVFCVIEVADSSYARDPGEKRAAYATAGVPQYVIVDLRRRLAEVNAGPAGGVLRLRVGVGDETVDLPLADLLP